MVHRELRNQYSYNAKWDGNAFVVHDAADSIPWCIETGTMRVNAGGRAIVLIFHSHYKIHHICFHCKRIISSLSAFSSHFSLLKPREKRLKTCEFECLHLLVHSFVRSLSRGFDSSSFFVVVFICRIFYNLHILQLWNWNHDLALSFVQHLTLRVRACVCVMIKLFRT